MAGILALSTALATLSAYFQLVLIIMIIYEIVKLFGSFGETRAGAEAGAGLPRAREAVRREEAAAHEVRGIEELEIKDEQQILVALQKIKQDLSVGSSASLEETLKLLVLVKQKLSILDALEKKEIEDERFLKGLKKGREFEALIGEERNLIELLGRIIEEIEEKMGKGVPGGQIVPYVQKAESIVQHLIEINKKEEADTA